VSEELAVDMILLAFIVGLAVLFSGFPRNVGFSLRFLANAKNIGELEL
jgi:hypothetical protein